jgi:hypothetical protein
MVGILVSSVVTRSGSVRSTDLVWRKASHFAALRDNDCSGLPVFGRLHSELLARDIGEHARDAISPCLR